MYILIISHNLLHYSALMPIFKILILQVTFGWSYSVGAFLEYLSIGFINFSSPKYFTFEIMHYFLVLLDIVARVCKKGINGFIRNLNREWLVQSVMLGCRLLFLCCLKDCPSCPLHSSVKVTLDLTSLV